MPTALRECFSVLKPGGMLLFRDYGLYDMTMLRFEPNQRVGFREYMRSDGTRSYFFCLDTVKNLFNCAGFIQLEIEYCCVKSVNRRNGKSMQRVWSDRMEKNKRWKLFGPSAYHRTNVLIEFGLFLTHRLYIQRPLTNNPGGLTVFVYLDPLAMPFTTRIVKK
ncbi:hypothetical protein Golob_018213 [Gossypium lobatum]|uniref:Methyltransferase n=1 Tax=Gossypium lobatum TaxID=34289 RepID=A0A7J8M9I9_9ROSI|nr:hypothetical protein [Gossypium lobatum]